ncbi:DNA polymerase III subunit alpha [Ferrimonas marina]|uniref:DNA polymerase III subunit alpha n=1 Tax=Ferrimonas marina TaxID=299255 RepID=A0A1M5TE54_9GAMM|nr:DNA polymerase III subunit alpha [Ferrimonas marina]SHH48988.1 DNA polymerase III, alpha subunit [Ferrimonas marina]
MAAQFVHLNVHSDLSMQDSLIRPGQLFEAVAAEGGKAVGLADLGNMHAAVKAYNLGKKHRVKPLTGYQAAVRFEEFDSPAPVILYAANERGYLNLLKIASLAFEHQEAEHPVIPFSVLQQHAGGVLLLCGGRDGAIGRLLLAGEADAARDLLERIKSTFTDGAYIELQRVGHPDDERFNSAAVALSKATATPCVATNVVRFLSPEDYESHLIRVAIARKVTAESLAEQDPYHCTPHQYLKSADEMAALFADLPAAVENTVRFAQRCNFHLKQGKYYLPDYPPARDAGVSEEDFLRRQAAEGLAERLEQLARISPGYFDEAKVKEYQERLKYELDIIIQMGFPGYFLIVMEFIQWSKDNDIPVGPGRGSGAGSLVAYALKITDLDPLQYDLLFERFLNPERVSMPDFDVDFCMDRRDEVIEHTADMYGHRAVGQIVTFGTMAARAVVRDVARALGHPYRVGDRIAKLIPGEPGTKLADAMGPETDLQALADSDGAMRRLLEHALKLEGLTRHTGRHAGGIVIAPGGIDGFSPTMCDPGGEHLAAQYDKSDVEKTGLVKFDYLGLRTLTIVHMALQSLNREREAKGLPPLHPEEIPLDCPKAIALLQTCETTAVFQLESSGMKNLIRRIVPENFEEMIALVALFRPGPLGSGMVDNFVNRKHGREEVEFIIPASRDKRVSSLLEPILTNTYGVILYQEQVMMAAQVLGGYSLGQADILRRAMGKKNPEEMEKQKSVFVDGCTANGISQDISSEIFTLIEKFAGYGFNKSHSAAYALVSYQTLWLKAHHPDHFMAAVMSSAMEKTDKTVGFIHESHRMGLQVLRPSINQSRGHFQVEQAGIRYGLRAAKGIGDKYVESMLAERDANGPFKDLADLLVRTNPGKTVLKAAIYAGALDDFELPRWVLLSQVALAQVTARDQLKKSVPLDHAAETVRQVLASASLESDAWTRATTLANEYSTLGLFLSGHPLDEYAQEVRPLISGQLRDYVVSDIDGEDSAEPDDETAEGRKLASKKRQERPAVIAAQLVTVDIRQGRRGKFAYAKLDDGTGQIEAAFFGKALTSNIQHLVQGALVVIKGHIRFNERTDSQQLVVREMQGLLDLRESQLAFIRLLAGPDFDSAAVTRVREVIESASMGGTRVYVKISKGGRQQERQVSKRSIRITDAVLGQLRDQFGEQGVELVYRGGGQFGTDDASTLQRDHRDQELKEVGDMTRNARHQALWAALNQAELVMNKGRP